MDIGRLDRIAPGHVNDRVHLRQLHQIAEVRPVAGPSAAIEIGAVGRRCHLPEENVVAAEADIVRRIACVERELRWAVSDKFQDHVAVEAHAFASLAHIGTMFLHDAPCVFMQHVETDFLQHPERGEVNRFQLVI
jgi:hypothetical protein